MSLRVDIFNMVISGTLLWLWPPKPQTIGCLHHLLVRGSQSEENLAFTGVRSYTRGRTNKVLLGASFAFWPSQNLLFSYLRLFLIYLKLQKSLGYKAGFYCKTTTPFFEYHVSFAFIISLTLKPSTNIIFFYKYKFLAEEKHWRWRENIKVSPFILESTPSPPVPVPASPSQDKQMQYFLHFLSKIVLWPDCPTPLLNFTISRGLVLNITFHYQIKGIGHCFIQKLLFPTLADMLESCVQWLMRC